MSNSKDKSSSGKGKNFNGKEKEREPSFGRKEVVVQMDQHKPSNGLKLHRKIRKWGEILRED